MDREEDKAKTETELRRADAIVLTYACDQPEALARLSSYWLPEIRRLEVSLSSHSQIMSFSASPTLLSTFSILLQIGPLKSPDVISLGSSARLSSSRDLVTDLQY